MHFTIVYDRFTKIRYSSSNQLHKIFAETGCQNEKKIHSSKNYTVIRNAPLLKWSSLFAQLSNKEYGLNSPWYIMSTLNVILQDFLMKCWRFQRLAKMIVAWS